MAKVYVTSAGGSGGTIATGVLQLQGGAAMSVTPTVVTDQSGAASTLYLGTTITQVQSPLRVTTNNAIYLDVEDGSGNNRFTVGRDPASQEVTLDFASNPTGSTTVVGGIRTYVDGVTLTDIMQFREDGRIQIGSTSASAMYWDNTNNRLGVGTATPTQSIHTTGNGRFGNTIIRSDAILCGTGGGGAFVIYGDQTLYQPEIQIYPTGNSVNITGLLGVGLATSATIPSAKLHVKGTGSTSATTSLLVQNSSGTELIKVADNGDLTTTDIIARSIYAKASTLDLRGNSSGSASSASLQGFVSGLGWLSMFTAESGKDFGQIPRGAVVNGTTIDASTIFQVNSTTKGFLPPRMTTTQKNAIASPAAGLMVYDTTLNKLCVYTTAWETITSI